MKIEIFSNGECQWWEKVIDEPKDDDEYYIGSAEAEPVELNEVDKIIIINTPYNPKEYKGGDIGCLSNSETWVKITHVY